MGKPKTRLWTFLCYYYNDDDDNDCDNYLERIKKQRTDADKNTEETFPDKNGQAISLEKRKQLKDAIGKFSMVVLRFESELNAAHLHIHLCTKQYAAK